MLFRFFLNLSVAALVAGGCVTLPTPAMDSRPTSSSTPGARAGELTRPAPPAVLDRGRAIFAVRCASCHGASGRGDGPAAHLSPHRPRDLGENAFRFRSAAEPAMPTDQDLLRTITRGIPPSGMPATSDLTLADRSAVVELVKSLSPAWRTIPVGVPVELGPEPARTPALRARGRALYVELGCDTCHVGPNGEEPPRTDLVDDAGRAVSAPDFRAGPLVMKRGQSSSDVVLTLLVGVPGTPMRSFTAQLRDRTDAWALAAFVDELQTPSP